jgi:hypothetical protein
MRELANHLSPGPVLYQQRVFTTDLVAAGNVSHFDQQGCTLYVGWRDATVNYAFVSMNLGRRQPHLIGIVVAGRGNARENLAHFGFIVDKTQQGLSGGTRAADTENVFRCRIHVDDQQVFVKKDDA